MSEKTHMDWERSILVWKKKNSVIIKRFSQKSEIITNSLILAINEKREECIACSVREYIQYWP